MTITTWLNSALSFYKKINHFTLQIVDTKQLQNIQNVLFRIIIYNGQSVNVPWYRPFMFLDITSACVQIDNTKNIGTLFEQIFFCDPKYWDTKNFIYF